MTKKKQPQQGSSTRGGYRDNAGRKSGWKNSDTCTIRIPKTFASQLIEIARRLDNGETLDNDTKSKFSENDLVTQSNFVGTDGFDKRGEQDELESLIDIDTESKYPIDDTVTESILDRSDTLKQPEQETEFDIDTKSILPQNDFVTESDLIDASQSGKGSFPDFTEALKDAKTIIKAKKSARESILRLLSKLYSVQVGPEDLS